MAPPPPKKKKQAKLLKSLYTKKPRLSLSDETCLLRRKRLPLCQSADGEKKPPNLKTEHKEGNARRERERDDVRGQNERPLLHVSVSSTTGLPHHQRLASDLWV
jgi:hypothetical protein